MQPNGNFEPESESANEALPNHNANDKRKTRMIAAFVFLILGGIVALVVRIILAVNLFTFLYSIPEMKNLTMDVVPGMRPTQTATPFPNPQLHPGEISYYYQFDNLVAWPVGRIDTDWMLLDRNITAGKYRWVILARKGIGYHVVPDMKIYTPRNEYQISVDVRMIDGPADAGYGLVFDQTDDHNYWEWEVNDAGPCWLVQKVNGEWKKESSFSRSRSPMRKGETNTLTVKVSKETVILYVNGQLVGSYSDTIAGSEGFLKSNGMGLSVDLYHPGDKATLEFDNFVVSKPETFGP